MDQPGQMQVLGGCCCLSHPEGTVGAEVGLGWRQSLDSAAPKASLAEWLGLKLEWAWAEGSPQGFSGPCCASDHREGFGSCLLFDRSSRVSK